MSHAGPSQDANCAAASSRPLRSAAIARLRSGTWLLAACLWLVPSGAPLHAAIWGYIDEQGKAHVATAKLDERYQLFFKGKSSVELAAPAPSAASEDDTALKRTAIYRRVTSHPNVKRFEPVIERQARAHSVDPALVKAVIAVESAFDPAAVSSKGALGLMQIVPDTAQRYGLADDAQRTITQKLFDPTTNVRIGTRYLRDLFELFDDELPLVLAAYNAGEGAVARYNRSVPPYPETEEYVKLVQQFYEFYRPAPPVAPSPPARITVPSRRSAR